MTALLFEYDATVTGPCILLALALALDRNVNPHTIHIAIMIMMNKEALAAPPTADKVLDPSLVPGVVTILPITETRYQ